MVQTPNLHDYETMLILRTFLQKRLDNQKNLATLIYRIINYNKLTHIENGKTNYPWLPLEPKRYRDYFKDSGKLIETLSLSRTEEFEHIMKFCGCAFKSKIFDKSNIKKAKIDSPFISAFETYIQTRDIEEFGVKISEILTYLNAKEGYQMQDRGQFTRKLNNEKIKLSDYYLRHYNIKII